MSQNKIDLSFLKIADIISEFSKCVSIKVGCVIVKDKRILTIGYNGTPSNYTNCNNKFNKTDFNREIHHEFSEQYEIHAELNAILYAAKTGININNSTLYCTVQPCWQCTKNIIQSGINRIVYKEKYNRIKNNDKLLDFIQSNNIMYEQIYGEEMNENN